DGGGEPAVRGRADSARPRDDRDEGNRQGPEAALPVGRRDGRRPAAVRQRRADQGTADRLPGALRPLVPPQPGRGGGDRGGSPPDGGGGGGGPPAGRSRPPGAVGTRPP